MAASGVSAGSAVALPTLLVGSQPPVAPPSLSRQGGTSMVVGGVEYGFSGFTRDSAGNPLAGVTVHLMRTIDDGIQDSQVSDASGAYTFTGVFPGYSYYLVAYLAGSPDVAGTTVNTLTGS